jgi:hypothetical protein
MPRKLTDAEVAEIRAQAAQGADSTAIAAAFGVTDRHVRRLVRTDQRTTLPAARPGIVAIAVAELLDGLELVDDAQRVHAAAALVLAQKLDALPASEAAAAAAAAPGLVRQLGDTLRDLRGDQDVDVAAAVRRMLQPLVAP